MNEFEEQLEHTLELFSCGKLTYINENVVDCGTELQRGACILKLANTRCFVDFYKKEVISALQQKHPEFFL